MESSISPKFDEMEHFQNLCCHVKDAQNDAYVRPISSPWIVQGTARALNSTSVRYGRM